MGEEADRRPRGEERPTPQPELAHNGIGNALWFPSRSRLPVDQVNVRIDPRQRPSPGDADGRPWPVEASDESRHPAFERRWRRRKSSKTDADQGIDHLRRKAIEWRHEDCRHIREMLAKGVEGAHCVQTRRLMRAVAAKLARIVAAGVV